MTLDKQLEIAQAILQTGLVKQVYHSCELIKDPKLGTLYPAYLKGNEQVYVGPDDTKGMTCYIRAAGDGTPTAMKTQSCAGGYQVLTPLRIVFFHDEEDRNRSRLIDQLLGFSFLQNVTLTRIVDDKYKLAREESDMRRDTMDGRTFYVAFDILVNSLLLPSTCAAVSCAAIVNPICTP